MILATSKPLKSDAEIETYENERQRLAESAGEESAVSGQEMGFEAVQRILEQRMSIETRNHRLYVKWSLLKRLNTLCDVLSGSEKKMTPEDLVEQWCNEVIETRFPQIKEHEQEVQKAEKKLKQALGSETPSAQAAEPARKQS